VLLDLLVLKDPPGPPGPEGPQGPAGPEFSKCDCCEAPMRQYLDTLLQAVNIYSDVFSNNGCNPIENARVYRTGLGIALILVDNDWIALSICQIQAIQEYIPSP